VDRIKRISYEVLVDHKSKFGEDFADNKKALDLVSIVRSKGLKNEIAGYITKFIKKEIREEKAKQARITASKSEQHVQEQSEIESTEDVVAEEITESVVDDEIVMDNESVVGDETIVEMPAEVKSSDNVEEKTE
jgi:small subunit ribosomal protein S17e